MDKIEKIKDEHQRFIRRFTTCDLLSYFSIKSIESYNKDAKGVTIIDLPYRSKKNGYIRTLRGFVYGQWELIQICFNSIKYSNDNRGKTVDENSFYNIVNENKVYNETIEKGKAQELKEIKLYEYIQCLTNIQFDFQALNIISKFNRMYQIMVEINNNLSYHNLNGMNYINFDKKFEEITKIKFTKFIDIYFLMTSFAIAKKDTDILKAILPEMEKFGYLKEEIFKVIKLQSKDYGFYKKCDNWNILRFFPIVKTSKGYIISNIYSLLLSLPDVMYWIIRNYYRDIESTDFTNCFGKCFEYYLTEVLNYYKIGYERIEESKKKNVMMPDWKVETGEYIFLIEQKSSLFPIDTRIMANEKSYQKMEEYFSRNIIKAFKQLNSYKVGNNKKKVIRICLMFENIYMQENVKYIIEKNMKFTSDKNLNWILNIDEFENIMGVLSKDEKEFNEIIQKKIELEEKNSLEGRSFDKILKNYKDNYAMKVLKHFDNMVERTKESLKIVNKYC